MAVEQDLERGQGARARSGIKRPGGRRREVEYRLTARCRTGENLSETVARALAEDLGGGDVTSEATVPEDARGRARIVQKQPGVVFGLAAVAEAMRQCGVEDVDNLVVEGQWREDVPAEVLLAAGPARALLAAERTALNFLGHLSGVATLTARFVEAVAGTGAAILDTPIGGGGGLLCC